MSHPAPPADIAIRLQLQRPGFALDIDMVLPGHGISVLYGPSGCGKTTVLRSVAGLEPSATGHVRLGEHTWLDTARHQHTPTHRRRLGYVFQEASLFAHLNVAQNMAFGARRAARDSAQTPLQTAIELLGIGHLLDRSVQDLSGGERQRVAIARAMATEPELLLLDEPLAALDTARKQEVMPWLERLRDELRIPMIYVTHALDELTRLGDHLVVMAQGRILASGPLPDTLSELGTRWPDAEDLGVLLTAKVVLKDEGWHLMAVETQGVRLWVRDDGASLGDSLRLRLLARDVGLSTTEPDARTSSVQNHVPAWVESIQADAHPSQALVRLRLGHGPQTLLARLTRKACHQLGLTPGQAVWAMIKAVAVVR